MGKETVLCVWRDILGHSCVAKAILCGVAAEEKPLCGQSDVLVSLKKLSGVGEENSCVVEGGILVFQRHSCAWLKSYRVAAEETFFWQKIHFCVVDEICFRGPRIEGHVV